MHVRMRGCTVLELVVVMMMVLCVGLRQLVVSEDHRRPRWCNQCCSVVGAGARRRRRLVRATAAASTAAGGSGGSVVARSLLACASARARSMVVGGGRCGSRQGRGRGSERVAELRQRHQAR